MVYKPEANPNHPRRNPFRAGRQITAQEHARNEARFQSQCMRDKELLKQAQDEHAQEKAHVKAVRDYAAHIREARRKGRKPRLAKKSIREHMRKLKLKI